MINRLEDSDLLSKQCQHKTISCLVARQPSDSSAQHSMKANDQNAHQPLQKNTYLATCIPIHPRLLNSQMRIYLRQTDHRTTGFK